MMAQSNRFNQRPDTLMQDHDCQIDETLLRRTAGPYICANNGNIMLAHQESDQRNVPISNHAS